MRLGRAAQIQGFQYIGLSLCIITIENIRLLTLIQFRTGVSMEIIKLKDEFIKLGQALKAAGLVETGAEAKDKVLLLHHR